MIIKLAIISAIILMGVFIYFFNKYQQKKDKQDRYVDYLKLTINPLSFESWENLDSFVKAMKYVGNTKNNPFNTMNHYDLDKIIETYPYQRIVNKLHEDFSINKTPNHPMTINSLGGTVTKMENLEKFYKLCDQNMGDNTSTAFPINGHLIVLIKQKGSFFISAPYDLMSKKTIAESMKI